MLTTKETWGRWGQRYGHILYVPLSFSLNLKLIKKLVKCTNFLKGTSKNGVEVGKTKPFHYLTFNFGVFL